jgi:hypothetical protein
MRSRHLSTLPKRTVLRESAQGPSAARPSEAGRTRDRDSVSDGCDPYCVWEEALAGYLAICERKFTSSR